MTTAVGARRDAEAGVIAMGEVGEGHETAGHDDVRNRAVGAGQQLAGAVEAQLQVILPRRAVERFAEQTLELTGWATRPGASIALCGARGPYYPRAVAARFVPDRRT